MYDPTPSWVWWFFGVLYLALAIAITGAVLNRSDVVDTTPRYEQNMSFDPIRELPYVQ